MGKTTDEGDVRRFLRSSEGRSALKQVRRQLLDCRITDVGFHDSADGIVVCLDLRGIDGHCGGNALRAPLPGFDLRSIRRAYGDILEREYTPDFPQSKAVVSEATDVGPRGKARCLKESTRSGAHDV